MDPNAITNIYYPGTFSLMGLTLSIWPKTIKLNPSKHTIPSWMTCADARHLELHFTTSSESTVYQPYQPRLTPPSPGSTNQTPLPEALSRLAEMLVQAITETTTVVPVLETMCGHGNTIGGALSEFRDLLALIPEEHHSRIGICVDTCHSFAAGYDLTSPAGFKAFLAEFDELIGIQFLRALHLNDSKAPRGSKRDLHANIGTGFLGLRAFHNVMNEPRFEGLPMVLETPIDRVPEQNVAIGDDAADGSESESEKKKQPKKGPKRPSGAGAAAVPDPGVWAAEIKLLESLIGMDPEGEEFRTLEARLSEEGRAEREKHQDQYNRKLEADEKKKAKEAGKAKGQKSLMDMMKDGAAKE